MINIFWDYWYFDRNVPLRSLTAKIKALESADATKENISRNTPLLDKKSQRGNPNLNASHRPILCAPFWCILAKSLEEIGT